MSRWKVEKIEGVACYLYDPQGKVRFWAGSPERLQFLADRLNLADELITDLCEHEGAEGFSDSTQQLIERWKVGE